MTSTSGVTLISDFGPPFVPPTSIAMAEPSSYAFRSYAVFLMK
jgi:hypothetical protein